MGQTIEINDTRSVADTICVFDTDRTLAGQDGSAYESLEQAKAEADEARRSAALPARLAARLFKSDPDIDHVFVMSNIVTVRRREPWDEEAMAKAKEAIAGFFIFYRD